MNTPPHPANLKSPWKRATLFSSSTNIIKNKHKNLCITCGFAVELIWYFVNLAVFGLYLLFTRKVSSCSLKKCLTYDNSIVFDRCWQMVIFLCSCIFVFGLYIYPHAKLQVAGLKMTELWQFFVFLTVVDSC